MVKVFHHVFAVISVALGVLIVIMGGIWVLQGLGIAFLDSFMANDIQWSIYGAILVLVGLGHIVWTATRGRHFRAG
jgi:cytochrome bd-type quinol oxidase subunit 1